MRDLNYGARDHLRPIFAAMKPTGYSASKAIEAVLRQVPVSVMRRVKLTAKEKRAV